MPQTNVYIIDDEAEMVELLVDVVKLIDLKVRGFTQASEFFKQITSFSENAILVLDLNMPEMDGIEVMRQLATMDSPPSLILMSGHDEGVLHSAEKLCHAHHLNLIDCLSKPLSIDNFKLLLTQQKIESQLAQQKTTNQAEEVISAEELKQGIELKQLVLHYQPQISVATGMFVGVEALVRWQHPIRGLIYPDSFIKIAEQNQLMGALTTYVLDSVVQQELKWQKNGLSVTVSVNVSAENITSLELPEQLSSLLSNNAIDPKRVVLEVTETALMGELVTSLDILTRLRLKGFQLSIDDFGTGYSSLSQLHRVPFTELKIDQSFVFKLSEDLEARAIVKTCIMLGHELNMKVIAEGVEDEQTLDSLRQLGCDVAQGYYICRPITADKLIEWAKQY